MLKTYKERIADIAVLLVLLGGLVYLHMAGAALVQRLGYIAFDHYNKVFPRDTEEPLLYPENGIAGTVIIDIDESSLQKLGQFPWPRTVLAEMVTQLKEMGARAVAFDIAFAEKDRTSPANLLEMIAARSETEEDNAAAAVDLSVLHGLPDHDEVFAAAIAAAGNVVTGFVPADQPTPDIPVVHAQRFALTEPGPYLRSLPYFAATIEELSAVAAGNGSFYATPEYDGVIRRVPMLISHAEEEGMRVYPSLSLEALRVALGEDSYRVSVDSDIRSGTGFGVTEISLLDKHSGNFYRFPTDPQGHVMVYYSGHNPQRYIPAWQILDGSAAEDAVRDKIVLVGASAIGLRDLRATPLDRDLPGVEIHAEIIDQILRGQHLQPQFFGKTEVELVEVLAILAGGVLIILFAPFLGAVAMFSLAFLLLSGLLAASVYSYQHFGYLLNPVSPGIAILTMLIVATVLGNLRSEKDKRFYRNAFGHYISGELMEEVLKSPEKLALGGEEREISVMFTDVRNFTSIAETMPPDALIRMMNDFLTPMTSAIMAQRGTIDKYMGDAIMAIWNAPVDVTDHPRRACLVALEMLKLLPGVNEKIKKDAARQKRTFHPINMGIGIASGLCSVGNMGSKQRFAYSAIGDPVNLAARLEGQTKLYRLPVLLAEATAKAVPDMALLDADLLTVKGRSEPERVYTLLGDENYAGSTKFKTLKKAHHNMLTAYRNGDFQQAKEILTEKCVKSAPKDLREFYAMYLERIENYIENPPPDSWNGVYVAVSK
ncbi:MAG: adenylate/guanylate cyclase domain-containing protein [Micavibrio sp.]|nr:MAG: adenylate/guanylate cyclase domain-containing protein [Micavibrio sp.]